jgi:hypothetical protein
MVEMQYTYNMVKTTIITPKTFVEKCLTPAEVIAIMMSTDPDVIYVRTVFLASERIIFSDTSFINGMQLMKSKKIFSDTRLEEILNF